MTYIFDKQYLVANRSVVSLLHQFAWVEGTSDERQRLLGCALLTVLASALGASAPLLFADVVDRFVTSTAGAVWLLAAYSTALWLGQIATELVWGLYARVEQGTGRRIVTAFFTHLYGLSLGWHQQKQTGAVTQILTKGASGVCELLFYCAFFLAPVILEFTLILSILAWRFPLALSLTVFLIVSAYLAILVWGSERLHAFTLVSNREQTKAYGIAVDGVLNYETVKYFGLEDAQIRSVDQGLRRAQAEAEQGLWWRSWTGMAQWTLLIAGNAVLLIVVGTQVGSGAFTVGGLVLFNTYLLRLARPLDVIGTVYRSMRVARADIEQMLELWTARPEILDQPGAIPLVAGRGEVRFEAVHFAYDTRCPVLNGIDLVVRPGRTLAIAGPSGAGKSSLIRLLARFCDPTEGRIVLDGQDLRDVTQASLRQTIAVVPQDTVLLNDTLFNNIHLARRDATPEEVAEAARAARLDVFVMNLPNGWETLVGERGLKLSGGEKQRVAIARAILKQPRLLLLDEATSALDSHTECEIQAELDQLTRNVTSIIIAHRLSTIVQADEIVWLQDGRIVERGRHTDLVSRGGHYAEAWRRQSVNVTTSKILLE